MVINTYQDRKIFEEQYIYIERRLCDIEASYLRSSSEEQLRKTPKEGVDNKDVQKHNV